MRIEHSLKILTALSTVAIVAACSSNRARHANDTGYNVTTAEWDSGPLDRDYQREHVAMETRHRDEAANARADESAEQRQQRQGSEQRDLEDRYARGKKAHSNTLPLSNHPDDHGHDNGYNQGHPNGSLR
jgi:hypothetical protein